MTISLIAGKRHDTKTMLEVIDDLRAKVESGEIVAFTGVGIDAKDGTMAWASSVGHVTRLRMMGAIAHLSHSYHAGELEDA